MTPNLPKIYYVELMSCWHSCRVTHIDHKSNCMVWHGFPMKVLLWTPDTAKIICRADVVYWPSFNLTFKNLIVGSLMGTRHPKNQIYRMVMSWLPSCRVKLLVSYATRCMHNVGGDNFAFIINLWMPCQLLYLLQASFLLNT